MIHSEIDFDGVDEICGVIEEISQLEEHFSIMIFTTTVSTR